VPLVIYGSDVEVSSQDIIQHADVWELISREIELDLDVPVGMDPTGSPREYAVVQKGGEWTSKNLDEIQEINAEFQRDEFYERDLTAIIDKTYIYYRLVDSSSGDLAHVGDEWTTVEDPVREEQFDSWYIEWYEDNGQPVATDPDTDEREVDEDVKENLENMGYLVE
jgi:hypothetical protein